MARINERSTGIGSYGVRTQGITVAGATKSYATYAAMLADQRPGQFAFVNDASGDPSVKAGFAIYKRTGKTWKKLFEEEAMDQDVASLVQVNWNQITAGKPWTSGGGTIASEDGPLVEAITMRHQHENKAVLDAITDPASIETLKHLGVDGNRLTFTFGNGTDGNPRVTEHVVTKAAGYQEWLQLVRPNIGVDLDLTVNLFANPELTTVVASLWSGDQTNLFYYFNGTQFSPLSELTPPCFPAVNISGVNVAGGQFVLVNLAQYLTSNHLYIQWQWHKRGGNSAANLVGDGICAYPAITPTSAASVGLTWESNQN